MHTAKTYGRQWHLLKNLLRPLEPSWRMTAYRMTTDQRARNNSYWTKPQLLGWSRSHQLTANSQIPTSGTNTWLHGSQRSAPHPGARIKEQKSNMGNAILRPLQHWETLYWNVNPAAPKCNSICHKCLKNDPASFGACCAPAPPKIWRFQRLTLSSTMSRYFLTHRSHRTSTLRFPTQPSNI